MNNNKSIVSCKRGFTQNCHAELVSASAPLVAIYRKDEILNQVQDDNRMGFTLIELLVVVLIIGILAAVAVPQYKKAVKKTQFSELQVLGKSIVRTVGGYYLANGKWPRFFKELDIEPPLNNSTTKNNCVKNTSIYCCVTFPQIQQDYGAVSCGRVDSSLVFQHIYASDSGVPFTLTRCIEKENVNLCKMLPKSRNCRTFDSTSFEGKNIKVRQCDIN